MPASPTALSDILPIAMLARAPLFLAVHPKVPTASMASSSPTHERGPASSTTGPPVSAARTILSMEAMNASLKLAMIHVPFKGTGESVPALLGGHIDVLFSAYPSLGGAADGHQVRLLATNGANARRRRPTYPLSPNSFRVSTSRLLSASSGAPACRSGRRRRSSPRVAVVSEPEVVRQLAVVGVEPAGAGPQEFASTLRAETQRATEAVRAAGIKPK